MILIISWKMYFPFRFFHCMFLLTPLEPSRLGVSQWWLMCHISFCLASQLRMAFTFLNEFFWRWVIFCDIWKLYGLSISVSINKVLVGDSHTYLLTYCVRQLSCQHSCEIVRTETTGATKPKWFTLWTSVARVC